VNCLFYPLIVAPDDLPLEQLQQRLDGYATRPLREAGRFRHQMRFNRLPTPVRRLAWWVGLNLSGRMRAKDFRTFGLTSVAGQGATTPTAYSVVTTALTNGPVDDTGRCPVTLVYDHRIMDGLLVSRCLEGIEAALSGVLAEELAALQKVSGAA